MNHLHFMKHLHFINDIHFIKDIKKRQLVILALAIISILLLFGIFQWIGYLTKNEYIVREMFDPSIQMIQDRGTSYTTHNVNLPLNTSTSCSNICGPNARCYKTGQQCLSDIDCPGCQPDVPPLPKTNTHVPGDNDAGKLTSSVFPTYSTLTTDYGTESKLFTSDKFSPAPQANYGENTWTGKFSIGQKLFDARYKPSQLPYMPNYPARYSLSGEFITNGPLESNAYLS